MKNKRQIFLLLAALSLSGCAHDAEERRLERKIDQTPPISSRGELVARSEKTLESTKDLTPGEKDALRRVHQAYLDENTKLQADSLKLRSILIKDVLGSSRSSYGYDKDEVALIKARMTALEDQRLSALMKAIREANQILGHWETGGQKVVDEFIDESYVNRSINW